MLTSRFRKWRWRKFFKFTMTVSHALRKRKENFQYCSDFERKSLESSLIFNRWQVTTGVKVKLILTSMSFTWTRAISSCIFVSSRDHSGGRSGWFWIHRHTHPLSKRWLIVVGRGTSVKDDRLSSSKLWTPTRWRNRRGRGTIDATKSRKVHYKNKWKFPLDTIYRIKSRRARDKELTFWQFRSHVIIFYDSVSADCHWESEKRQKVMGFWYKKILLYVTVCQNYDWKRLWQVEHDREIQ